MAQRAAGRHQDRRDALARSATAAAGSTGREVDLAPLEAALARLPAMRGRAIRVRIIPDPHALGGRLLSGGGRGQEVHAGSRIPAREVVLDQALMDRPHEFARIFLHELFHFVWVRLGNARRRSYEELLMRERVGGELGWSADMRKAALTAADRTERTKRWREYACESFCDTGAWFASRIAKHTEYTLAVSARRGRRRWFSELCQMAELRF